MDSITLKKKMHGFQLIAQEKLQAVICSIPGKKDLILQSSLIKALERICGASWLKLKGIQRIFKLDDIQTVQHSSSDQVQLYMLHSDLLTFQRVLHLIKLSYEGLLLSRRRIDSSFKYFHVICVPSCFAHFHQLLESRGLYGIVGLHSFNWNFIPLDDRILSLEMPNVFSSLFIRSDYSFLLPISHSLRTMQLLCGIPDLVLTLGTHSDNIMNILHELGPLPSKTPPQGSNKENGVTTWLVIDRDKDYISTLLTPSIYGGLLLEVFSCNAGTMELQLKDNKIVQQQLSIYTTTPETGKDTIHRTQKAQQKEIKTSLIHLNGEQDKIFAENCYKNFLNASQQMRFQVQTINNELQKFDSMKLVELHDYVNRKLPKITHLKNRLLCHLSASEKLIELLGDNYLKIQTLEEDILLNKDQRKRILSKVEKLLITNPQQFNSLRLLCLLHVTIGLNTGELCSYMKNFCNYFGNQNLKVFHELAKAGLLPQLEENDTTAFRTASKILLNIPLNITKFPEKLFQLNAKPLNLITSSLEMKDNKNNQEISTTSSGGERWCASSSSPQDFQHVFNGTHVPVIAQLCTLLIKASNIGDFIANVNGNHNVNMKINGRPLKVFQQSVKLGNVEDVLPINKPNILVYVVGGVTYAESAACHIISKKTNSHILVASDCLLSGSDLISRAF